MFLFSRVLRVQLRLIGLWALLGLLAAACSSTTPTFQPVATEPLSLQVSGSPVAGYPPPVSGAYPAPQEPTQGPALTDPAVTPDPNQGVVRGVLMVRKGGTAQPVASQTLYLAEILKDDAGVERAASVDRQTSPRTMTNAEGHFVFVNVPPGRYGLVLDTVVDSYLLNDPASGGSLLVETTAGQEVALGELVYDTLPIP